MLKREILIARSLSELVLRSVAGQRLDNIAI